LEAEQKQPVVLREGFAIAHATMDRNPRLAITFGIFPSGVMWKESGERVNLIAMVLCAEDTYGTWRDYLKKFAIVFRARPELQGRLIASKSADEFLRELREAETSLIK
jgi:mannitol/fructose-specific phosphotransferase system IIA component (Ntr-type)